MDFKPFCRFFDRPCLTWQGLALFMQDVPLQDPAEILEINLSKKSYETKVLKWFHYLLSLIIIAWVVMCGLRYFECLRSLLRSSTFAILNLSLGPEPPSSPSSMHWRVGVRDRDFVLCYWRTISLYCFRLALLDSSRASRSCYGLV